MPSTESQIVQELDNTNLVNELGIAILNKNLVLASQSIAELARVNKKTLQLAAETIKANCTLEEWEWFQQVLTNGKLTDPIEPLSPEERQLKDEIESRMEKQQAVFIEIARDLWELKERRLYREEFLSWKAYCEIKLEYSFPVVCGWIKGYCTWLKIKSGANHTTTNVPPKNVQILRELSSIGANQSKEIMIQVWENAVETSGGTASISDVRVALDKLTKPEASKPVSPKDLKFKPDDLVLITNDKLGKKWGKVIEITNGLRYKIKSGNTTSTYEHYDVSKMSKDQKLVLAQVEVLYAKEHPHIKALASTFYSYDVLENWQVDILSGLLSLES